MFSHSAIWVHPWLYRERECNLALSQRTYTSLQKNRAVMEIIVLGFSKASVCMKNAWGFHREALGWTRSCCFLLLHLELLKWNSVAHSCPVLRDGGICQTMLLRAGLKMVSVQLCSCNAETHLSSSCILEGSIRISECSSIDLNLSEKYVAIYCLCRAFRIEVCLLSYISREMFNRSLSTYRGRLCFRIKRPSRNKAPVHFAIHLIPRLVRNWTHFTLRLHNTSLMSTG